MNLSSLSNAITGGHFTGPDVDIASLAYDSRQSAPGALFVALRGAKSDGHRFISQAVSSGAAAVCVDSQFSKDGASQFGLPEAFPTLVVPDTRRALALLAAAFYGEPTRLFDLIGVTGTNGKTTTTYMIESIFRTLGEKTGLIGTVGALINGTKTPLERTTPESADLQRLFAQMAQADVRRVVMEVSSQGALARRTEQCAFDTGVWTNLTQDHLDAHGTMEAYFAEKLRLFTEYPAAFPDKPFTGVINADDSWGERVAKTVEDDGHFALRYALEADAPLRAQIDSLRPDGTDMTVHYQPPIGSALSFSVSLRMGGKFNVYNALAAVGTALLRRVPVGAIKNGLERLAGVPGRFELVESPGKEFHVLVDYAHTPDGLENVLSSARALAPKRLLCVFGCGGDRDRTKRPIMGRIASQAADITVITSDNPRCEHPGVIVADILAGIEDGAANPHVVVEIDRRAAIHKALCELAQPGDLVVIAGKGHESGQQFADYIIPFDDRQVAREVLTECG